MTYSGENLVNFRHTSQWLRAEGSVIDIATMLRPGRSGVRNPVGARDFFFCPKRPNRLWVPGFFSGGKSAGGKDSHLPASSAEVKNEWSCTSDLCTRLHGVDR